MGILPEARSGSKRFAAGRAMIKDMLSRHYSYGRDKMLAIARRALMGPHQAMREAPGFGDVQDKLFRPPSALFVKWLMDHQKEAAGVRRDHAVVLLGGPVGAEEFGLL